MKERIGKMKNSKKKGFTLIELVVVIAILAILALIMVPNLTAYLGKAKEAKIDANMKNIHTAAEMVRQTEGSLIEERIKTFSNNEDVIVSEVVIADEDLEVDKYTVFNKGGQTVVKYKTQDGKVFTFPDVSNVNNGETGENEVYLATDEDFEWVPENSTLKFENLTFIASEDFYRYIGPEDVKVKIPHEIKGNPITSYFGMFAGTTVEKVISDNPNITDMSEMFGYSQATTLDLSSFNTSNVTDMSGMFAGSQATELDLSSFDTSNVTNMSYMFYDSQATELDLSSFDTSKVTDMRRMFESSQATSLDLSNFDTSKVTIANMDLMFRSSQATTGYARTQADATKFNSSLTSRPEGLTFVVKP